jgi:transcriptional regulator with XRE-family HTH domain
MERAVGVFGRNVRKARQNREWTQEDLAYAAGLNPVQISRIERGAREVRLTTVVALLEAFDLQADDLIDAEMLNGRRR